MTFRQITSLTELLELEFKSRERSDSLETDPFGLLKLWLEASVNEKHQLVTYGYRCWIPLRPRVCAIDDYHGLSQGCTNSKRCLLSLHVHEKGFPHALWSVTNELSFYSYPNAPLFFTALRRCPSPMLIQDQHHKYLRTLDIFWDESPEIRLAIMVAFTLSIKSK